jgi:regulator of protease activity HflC (stomatin/prohibitin superfamily)
VITEDNLVVSIGTVVYFQVTDARAASLRDARTTWVPSNCSETTLPGKRGRKPQPRGSPTGRDNINGRLRIVLDEATGQWGVRVGRVELKAIDPPLSIQDSMEKQMRAERQPSRADPTAEGTK